MPNPRNLSGVACLCIVVCGLVALYPTRALAHAWSVSGIVLEQGDAGLREELELDTATLAAVLHIETAPDGRLSDTAANTHRTEVLSYLDRTIALRTDDGPCDAGPVEVYAPSEERLRIARGISCADGWRRLHVENRAFQEDSGGHTFIGTFRTGAPGSEAGFVFRPTSTELWLARDDESRRSEPAPTADFITMFRQGVHHILTGYDHALFLVSLVALSSGLSDLIFVITSFTLAHSLTLALGALGVVTPSARIIEPAIALTILFVALENMIVAQRRLVSSSAVPWTARHRPLVTFFFGFIHGFGFSGQLRDLGLTSAHLVKALLAFNLGVEAGQLVIVAALFAALRAPRGDVRREARLLLALSTVVALVAAAWFVQRTIRPPSG